MEPPVGLLLFWGAAAIDCAAAAREDAAAASEARSCPLPATTPRAPGSCGCEGGRCAGCCCCAGGWCWGWREGGRAAALPSIRPAAWARGVTGDWLGAGACLMPAWTWACTSSSAHMHMCAVGHCVQSACRASRATCMTCGTSGDPFATYLLQRREHCSGHGSSISFTVRGNEGIHSRRNNKVRACNEKAFAAARPGMRRLTRKRIG